jgi:hypothetical protein
MEGLHLVTANIFAPQELIVILLLAVDDMWCHVLWRSGGPGTCGSS